MENTQRPIKFRAWDGKDITYSQDVYDNDLCEFFAKIDDRSRELSEHGKPKCTLEQFTGILDKNGKEIYEGDVVEDVAGDPRWSGGQISSVSFDDKAQGFRAHRVLDRGLTGSPRLLGDWCEVIGNVHETSDLIESGTNQKEA